MAKNYFGTKLLATALATFALASCQSESTLLEPVAGNYRDVVLKGIVSKGDMTRTDLNLSSDHKKLLLTWNLGDKIQVSEQNGNYVGYLLVTGFADEEHTLAKFEGKVRMLDNDGTQTLSFAYLGKGINYEAKQGRTMTPYVYDFASQTNAGVNALAANDLLLADGDVEVKKGEATFATLSMKRQFAYGRFTLLYNDEPLQFDENTVVYVNTENNDIKTGATVEFPKTISPAGESSISLATSENDFYVTFVPGSVESKIKFNVTINGDVYEGYSNTYLIEKNDFYRKAQGLEVAEALPINVRKTDGSDDEHNFALTYNANYGSNDTWTDNQSGVGLSYTFTLSDYAKVFDETNEGYTFVGWTLNADGSGDILVPNATLKVAYPDGNATVYAKWKKTVYEYILNWEDKDGNPIDTKTVQSEEDPYKWAVKNDDAIQKAPEGYEFAGWADKANPTTPVEQVTFTKDRMEITVVPVYTEKTYTWKVQWKDDPAVGNETYKTKLEGGTSPHVLASVHPANPTKEGYKFLGWEYEGKMVKSETEVVMTADNLNPIIYAKWEKATYDLQVYAYNNDGTDNHSIDTEHNKTLPHTAFLDNLNVPTRTGYKFMGWGATADATVAIESVIFKTPDPIKVYAIWKKDVSNGNITAPGAGGSDY